MKLQIAMGTYSHGKLPDLQYKGVPFVAQNHVNLCGDACVNMLFLFYEVTPPAAVGQQAENKQPVSTTLKQKRNKNDLTDLPGGPDDNGGAYRLTDNPRGALAGLDQESELLSLEAAGLQPIRLDSGGNFLDADQIEAALDLSPFMVTVQFSAVACHCILVFGFKKDTLFYHDPWRGADMSMALEKFNEALPKENTLVAGSLLGVTRFNRQKVDTYSAKFTKKYQDLGLSSRTVQTQNRGVALPGEKT